MVVHQKLINFDTYFRTVEGNKIILNDLDYYLSSDQNRINDTLVTAYNIGEQIQNIAKCDCGELKGNFRIGYTCPKCGSECKKPFDKVKPLIWIRAFDKNHRFLNIAVWNIFSRLLGSKVIKAKTKDKTATFDWMRYLADTSYPLRDNQEREHITDIIENVLGGQRSYPKLVSSLHAILDRLEMNKKFRDKNIQQYRDLLNTYKDDLFSTYLPIINKNLFVEERTPGSKLKNVTLAAGGIRDIIQTVLKWCTVARESGISENRKSIVVATIESKLTSTLNSYFTKYLVQKNGVFRHNVYGARSHFTFRDVIVSIQGKHRYDEIHPPWIIMVTVFRPHILNKLLRKGYTYRDANLLYFDSCKQYNQTVDDILTELIQDTPTKGIPCILHRNPSLLQGSAQLVYITGYKKDLLDKTCAVSTLIIKQPNGDFDRSLCHLPA